MCTAATYKTKDFYFGRTLDYEFSYGDKITITPRNYTFDFKFMGEVKNHYAIIGMAHIANDYPLYYDAMNEKVFALQGLILLAMRFIIIRLREKKMLRSLNLLRGYFANVKI